MARKGILKSNLTPGNKAKTPPAPSTRPKPQGAVGALQSSLNKLQENAVQDIDPTLIDGAGVEDRLGFDAAAQRQLIESLRTYGQQVPVLLRPHPTKPGRYEIVYGRRRLAALQEIGQPVKAMIRQLDDHELVMAQGQENTSRQDLSFVEKASFAAQLQDTGYERQTIADALSIDLPMLSRMLRVGVAFPLPFLRSIGSAPGIGRDRWLALVKLFETPAKKSRATVFMARPEFAFLNSDARFDAVFEHATTQKQTKRQPAPKPRALRDPSGEAMGEIRRTSKGTQVTIKTKGTAGFDAWVDKHAESLIQELHVRWRNEQKED